MRVVQSFAVLLVLTVTTALAERVPLSPEQQNAESTHIVTGVVKTIYSKDVATALYGKGTVETRYLIEIEVQTVEKGAAIEKSDLVYARCWRLKKHGANGLVPGPSGHFEIPQEGQKIRAFLAKGKYGPTGQSDNGFTAVYPNGFESLKTK